MPKNHSRLLRGGNYYGFLLYRLALALVLFWLSRLCFYLFNLDYFSHLDTGEVLRLLFFGLRFDLAALFMLNAPFILLISLPTPLRNFKPYRLAASWLFYVGNGLGLMANFVDVVYFRFTQKRMTGDIFSFVGGEVSLGTLFPRFVRDFWPYMLLFVGFVVLLVVLSQRKKLKLYTLTTSVPAYYAGQFLLFLLSVAVTIIGIRGGFQLKPINIITAGKYAAAGNAPVLLNTPFTIIKTLNEQGLKPVHYFDEPTLDSIFNPVFNENSPDSSSDFKPENVVVIIMESLSAEHIGAFNTNRDDYQGFTPFLDSLMQHSLVYEGFANGKQSIEGIPTVVASLPSLMDRPYINSAYAGNRINSLASVFDSLGYRTSFFHGGTNGTMDFDGFAEMAGYRQYFGRTEYGNDADYDGNWGIFDEPFFGFFADQLSSMPQPFFSTIFSLSAHHPYTIPEKYQGRFRKGNLKIQQAVMYADYSLGKFFRKAAKMPWYQRTLFVITADHTSEAYLPEYQTRAGMYRIPVIFYAPSGLPKARRKATAAQADIMPSVLGALHYHRPFVAFGENLFDTIPQPTFAVNYLNGSYQILMDGHSLLFDGSRILGFYDLSADPLMQTDLAGTQPERAARMLRILKAYIQQYNNRMINNQLTPKS